MYVKNCNNSEIVIVQHPYRENIEVETDRNKMRKSWVLEKRS